MHCENFKITEDNIGIIFGDDYFDLHNEYDLTSHSYSQELREAQFTWTKVNESQQITLCCRNVSLYKTKPRNPLIPESESLTISFIGFLHPDEIEVMNGFSSNSDFITGNHFIIGLESEAAYKISAELAKCTIINNV
jgi:hypothetical protein